MIREVKLTNVIAIIKKEITPEEFIQQQKEKLNKWYKDLAGEWVRVTEINENKEDIMKSIIKIEAWGNEQFTPLHSQAYSNMMIEIDKMKGNLNERNINVYSKNKIISK